MPSKKSWLTALMNDLPSNSYRFHFALATALLVHGFILFGLATANVITLSNRPSPMEVTINATSAIDAPEKAEHIAMQNQLGSGDSDRDQEPQSTKADLLIEELNLNMPAAIPSATQQIVNIDELNYRIVYSGTGLREIGWKQYQQQASVKDGFLPDHHETLETLSLAVAKLETRLFDQRTNSARKPRTLLVTSTSAIASSNANYIRQWRDRVETIGNLYYPEEARQQELYGDVRLIVGVLASGIVDSIEILSSSGSKVLDNAAIESIHLASPFEPFPQEIAANYDRIDVIRTWQFRKNRLVSSAN